MSDSDSSGSSSENEEEEKKDPNYVDWRNMQNIRVICRFRPVNSREIREEKSQGLVDDPISIQNAGQTLKLRRPGMPDTKPMEFNLDKILNIKTSQQQLYLNVGKPMVEACLEGYNTTVFAYGQTGSGKTYTMFGPEKLTKNEQLGCVQRCLSFLFETLKEKKESGAVQNWMVKTHFVQLYREKLHDLLESEAGIPLKIRFDPVNDCPYVPNLKQVDVTEIGEVIRLLGIASKNRAVDKTLMNAESSRSHMIMTLSIEQILKDGTLKKSKLNFADLAGSETYEKALGGGKADRKKIEELKTINLSLTNLTTCINYLSKGRKASYRSSQLTFYLMDSLGGNSKTTLVVACSPHIFNRSETIRTLRFAKTAKAVKNVAKINKELSKAQLEALVKKLKRENKKLKAKLALFEAELTKNGIDLPIDTGKAKKHKRSKSNKSLLSKETKKNLFGTHNLTTSTTNLLKDLTIDDDTTNAQLKPSKSVGTALPSLSEENNTTSVSNGGTAKRRKFGGVDESAYNKLKEQFNSIEKELFSQETESSLLKEQLDKKNIELEALTEELQESRNVSQQLENIQKSKKEIAMQLQLKNDAFLQMQDEFKKEREKYRIEQTSLEEDLNDQKNSIQQYESIMDSMKLNNDQLKNEVKSLREMIEESKQVQNKQDKKIKQQKQKNEQSNKANEIISKYFTVAQTKKDLSDSQLNNTENKIETLQQSVLAATTAYEKFTGHNFSLNPEPQPVVPVQTDDIKHDNDDKEEDDKKETKDDEKNNDEDKPKKKKSKKPKKPKTPKASSALQNKMAMFGGAMPKKKRRKSKNAKKIKEYTDLIIKQDPKKNLVFQTERLTHYLNSAMTTMDKQKKLHTEEMDLKMKQKEEIITGLNKENKDLKKSYNKNLSQKDDKIEALQKQIEDLKLQQQNAMLTSNMRDVDEDDGEDDLDLFGFNDQIAYLSKIGKGQIDDDDDIKSIRPQTSAHAPTQIAFWRQKLTVGAKLDCLDEACLWWTSMVTDCDGYKIKVSYDGFDSRWDEWVDRGSTRIAPYMSKAKGGKDTKGVSVNLKVVGKKKDKKGKTRRIYKQGFLVKQGKRFKSYKTRYFVLLDDGTMQYFKKMTDQTPAGTFNINNMIETRRIAYPNKKDLYGFEIVTKDRTWRFQAHSDDVVADWIGVIHAVSKGVEPDDDEQQHAVIYSGFTDMPKMNKMNKMNGPITNGNTVNGNHSRRNTVQSGTLTHRPKGGGSVHTKSTSVTRLSIQEEASSHPPINRAAFSQLMLSSTATTNEDDSSLDGGDVSNFTIPTNNKSRPGLQNEIKNNQYIDPTLLRPLDQRDEELTPASQTDDDMPLTSKERNKKQPKYNVQHEGWMHKAGKWDANWTYRYCILTSDPVTLRCFVAPNKKQTKCIHFKDVKSCIELKKNSEKFNILEIPTAYAFQIVTSKRVYTFACKSRNDVNVWLKKIRKIVDVSAHGNTAKLTKRSSIIRLGSALNQFGKSFGRLVGVTPEHVTTTSVMKTEDVQIQRSGDNDSNLNKTSNRKPLNQLDELSEWSNINISNMNIKGISEDRRSSLPILSMESLNKLNKYNENSKNEKKSRRKSAPDLRTLVNPKYRPMSIHELDNMNKMNNDFFLNNNNEKNGKKKTKLKKKKNRAAFEEEVGTRHRGTFDRNTVKFSMKEIETAQQQERHTIAHKPTQKQQNLKRKKKEKQELNENIQNVLKNAQNDENIIIESDEGGDLSDLDE